MRARLYAFPMTLRMHPVSKARWERLAAMRRAYGAARSPIDLMELEAETADPCRRVRAEHALIQAHVEALEPQRLSAR